jgi:hypothetical protein
MAAGAAYADIATAGSLTQRLGGAAGGPGYLNAPAFTTIPVIGGNGAAGTGGAGWGNSGIAPILGPGQFNFNVSASKMIPIRERLQLQYRTEFYNFFNHAQFSNPSVNFAVPSTFGLISSTNVNPRLIQFALKLAF